MNKNTKSVPMTNLPDDSSLSERLLARNQRQVDLRTRQRAVLHWIDWMGCVAAGSRAPVTRVLQEWQLFPGADPAPLKTTPGLLGSASSPMHALMLEAAAANVEEMDDMHRQGILHPGPVIMPALACMARSQQFSSAQILDALVRGYEIMIRIGRAVGSRHYFYWHNTATAGVFGSAAACSDLLGLPLTSAAWALGNAGTQAAGLWQVRLEPVMSKQLHTGHAAWAGLLSASLASAGFTGPRFILEGERGFFAAMCAGTDISTLAREEDDWLIHETSFKPWPACRHTHAVIDGVLALRAQLGGRAVDIESAVVESFDDAIAICDRPAPSTRTEAKFSLQYCVAAATKLGPLEPQHFDESFFLDEHLQSVAKRVTLQTNAEINAAYPEHYGARVTLILRDGRSLSHRIHDALGDPERPLEIEAVLDKASRLMAYGGVSPERVTDTIAEATALLDVGSDEMMQARFPIALLAPLFEASNFSERTPD